MYLEYIFEKKKHPLTQQDFMKKRFGQSYL